MAATADNPSQLVGALAETYAQALFEAAGPDRAEEVDAELRDLVDLLAQQPKLAALFEHKTIDAARRDESIDKLLGNQVSEITGKFLHVLNHKRRLEQLPAIAQAFNKRLKRHRNQIDVGVTTAAQLDEPQREKIKQQLDRVLGKDTILHTRVDEGLIGGLVIRIEDKVIDGSVRTQLRRLSRSLHRRARQAVQDSLDTLLEEEAEATAESAQQ